MMATMEVHRGIARIWRLSGAEFSRARGITSGVPCLVMAVVLAFAAGRAVGAAVSAADSDAYDATSSRAARQNAQEAIPYARLDPQAQAKVRSVLADVTFFRRLPIRQIQCDPEFYLFLVQHPDVVVNIWKLFGIDQLSLEEIATSQYRFQDGEGTTGTIEYLYSSADTHLVYGEGTYEGPVLARPVRGKIVLLLKSGFVVEPDGRYLVTTRVDAFLQVDRSAIEVLTKAFHPLVGKVADINFIQTTAFVESLSRTAESDPSGVGHLAGKLSQIRPEVRQQFADLSARLARKSAERNRPLPLGRSTLTAQAQDAARR